MLPNITRSVARPSPLTLLISRTSSASFSAATSRKAASTTRPFLRATKTPVFKPTTSFTRTMATNKADGLLQLLKDRRSYYVLTKDLTISTDRAQEIVKEALAQVPSSFNSQSNRVVVLFGADHEKLWDITSETLKAIVPADSWEATGSKLALFKGAAGSVLFFEDEESVKELQTKFALYADRFPAWATQSIGMLELAVWTAFEAEGLGANLQHYNPLIDAKVAETWKIPSSWKLNAQLVFGGRGAEPSAKDFKPIADIYKVYGA